MLKWVHYKYTPCHNVYMMCVQFTPSTIISQLSLTYRYVVGFQCRVPVSLQWPLCNWSLIIIHTITPVCHGNPPPLHSWVSWMNIFVIDSPGLFICQVGEQHVEMSDWRLQNIMILKPWLTHVILSTMCEVCRNLFCWLLCQLVECWVSGSLYLNTNNCTTGNASWYYY